MIKQ
jgi:hypothetical protein